MRAYYLILAVLALALTISLAWYVRNHDPLKTTVYPRCVLHDLTGLNCPGCGATRAVHALLNGRIVAALAWNPFVIVVLPIIFALVFVDQRMRKIRGDGIKYLAHVVLGVVAIFFLLRNLPSPSNALLAPMNTESSGKDQN